MSSSALEPRTACRIQIRGMVQGVGFRPFIHRLAARHELNGWVRNASGDVQLSLEGAGDAIEAFMAELRTEAPPLADIEAVEVVATVPVGLTRFIIEESAGSHGARLPVPPDVALCATCERELLDPANRRYRHPFITCTDCGPRFTVIQQLPYDRERTSMAAFAPCAACALEYASPGNRRYHSETNCCPSCGPTLWFECSRDTETPRGEEALARAAELLTQGGIVALRGFGGYHLACDATSESAVSELRRRKQRDAKPLAVMVPSVAAARRLARVHEVEAGQLERRERPVVLLQARPHTLLAASVAPGLQTIGLMLPSTPLHLLLLEAVGRPLVMTSGNRSEEPIAIGNAEARERLAGIADGFLMHDREILSRTDDSVLRLVEGQPLLVRRSRGYAPRALSLPVATPVPLLAVGPHLKNTFTLAHSDRAWPSPHIGDLDSLEGLDHFRQMLAVYRRLFGIEPEAVAHDLHPGYLSTRVALELGLSRTVPVQHHHAHIAAVMAEHGVTEPVIGVAFDGTGYGLDGAVWGGEILAGDLTGFQRLAHLRYAPLPGGDLAARRPWRSALGYASLDPEARLAIFPILDAVPAAERTIAEQQLAARVNAPLASSMGRLFDAAAAIIGVRLEAGYEGQAAMELESLAGDRAGSATAMPIEDDGTGALQLDPLPLLTWLAWRRRGRADAGDLAADFHDSLCRGTVRLISRAAAATGYSTVVLAGGVFQNARLLTSLRSGLEQRHFRVLVPRALPPNDGAISYGQAAIAAALLSAGR
jgi:hydrogenase maturation protein HypF